MNAASTKISALRVFNGYPNSDLLPLEPPRAGESIRDWHHRCWKEIDECGDSQFKAIIAELMEADDVVKALQTLQNDIQGVLDVLED